MTNKTLKKVVAIISVLAIIGCACVFAFAASPTTTAAGYGDAGSAITDTMSFFISYVVDMFRVVGVLIGVYAIAQFALAFKDDNPDQKSKSTILLVVAVLLIMVKTLAGKIIEFSGIEGIDLNQGFLS